MRYICSVSHTTSQCMHCKRAAVQASCRQRKCVKLRRLLLRTAGTYSSLARCVCQRAVHEIMSRPFTSYCLILCGMLQNIPGMSCTSVFLSTQVYTQCCSKVRILGAHDVTTNSTQSTCNTTQRHCIGATAASSSLLDCTT